MAEPHEEQRDARRFLLGYLDEEERAQMEKRLTSESDYLEMVLETESELMEDYVAGQLSEDNAIRFRKYVLTSQQQVEQLLGLRAGLSAALKRVTQDISDSLDRLAAAPARAVEQIPPQHAPESSDDFARWSDTES